MEPLFSRRSRIKASSRRTSALLGGSVVCLDFPFPLADADELGGGLGRDLIRSETRDELELDLIHGVEVRDMAGAELEVSAHVG